ncbi:MAG TPA: DUF5684 domain-containing protein [Candidatus Didemnitutus sp.]|nr:DUF5684 domain-containing protein [Candidatus Didemnitutus sp.]
MMNEYTGGDGGEGFIAMFLGAYLVFSVLGYLFFGFCIGKILEKAGKPLWTGFVPIYNLLLLIEIVGRPTWWIVLTLIPFVNVVILIIVSIDLAKSFGKDVVWGLLIAFVTVIGLPMLAFGDATYQGPSVTSGS